MRSLAEIDKEIKILKEMILGLDQNRLRLSEVIFCLQESRFPRIVHRLPLESRSPPPIKPDVSVIQEDSCSIAPSPENNKESVVLMTAIIQEEALPPACNNPQQFHVCLLAHARDFSSTKAADNRHDDGALTDLHHSFSLPLVEFWPHAHDDGFDLFSTDARFYAPTYWLMQATKIYGPTIFDPGISLTSPRLIAHYFERRDHNAIMSLRSILSVTFPCPHSLLMVLIQAQTIRCNFIYQIIASVSAYLSTYYGYTDKDSCRTKLYTAMVEDFPLQNYWPSP